MFSVYLDCPFCVMFPMFSVYLDCPFCVMFSMLPVYLDCPFNNPDTQTTLRT
jgi:hypothetical protein